MKNGVSVVLQSQQYLVLSPGCLTVATLMGLQWDLVFVMCTFPVTKDVEHLVMGFPATRILLVKCLTKSFAHYLLLGGLSLYY